MSSLPSNSVDSLITVPTSVGIFRLAQIEDVTVYDAVIKENYYTIL